MKKNCFYLISLIVSLCLFASCSKNKDEEPEVKRFIPFFELEGEDLYYSNIEYKLNADVQTLTIVAHSNMEEVRVETNYEAFWIHYKEMIKKPESEQLEFVFDIEANATDSERVGYVSLGSPLGTDPTWAIIPRLVIVTQASANP